jgi:hypothetical protein
LLFGEKGKGIEIFRNKDINMQRNRMLMDVRRPQANSCIEHNDKARKQLPSQSYPIAIFNNPKNVIKNGFKDI